MQDDNVLIEEKTFDQVYYRNFVKSLFLMFLLGSSTIGIGSFAKEFVSGTVDWIFMGFWIFILLAVYSYYLSCEEISFNDLKTKYFHLKLIKS